jgi:BlaI family penicillinase repressor
MPSKISPAEWEVLNALWDNSPATVPELCERLAGNQSWHPKTVGTFLIRLVDKGVLSVRKEGKVNVYSPLISRQQCVAEESDTFLQRVFRGATAPLLAHFCESAELSDEEIGELQRLLEQRSQKARQANQKKGLSK